MHGTIKKVVYTVVTNNKNRLIKPFYNPTWDYICFTDNVKNITNPWRAILLKSDIDDPRRTSRLPKILAHQYLPNYNFSIYIDGSIEMIANPEILLTNLKSHYIALFAHSWRNCIYEEAKFLIENKRGEANQIKKQIDHYRNDQYPSNNGLINGQVIIRHHSESIKKLNAYWWKIYNKFSERDQLSFNYCTWKLGIEYSTIPGNTYTKNPYVIKREHNYPTVLNWAYLKRNLKMIVKGESSLLPIIRYLLLKFRKQ